MNPTSASRAPPIQQLLKSLEGTAEEEGAKKGERRWKEWEDGTLSFACGCRCPLSRYEQIRYLFRLFCLSLSSCSNSRHHTPPSSDSPSTWNRVWPHLSQDFISTKAKPPVLNLCLFSIKRYYLFLKDINTQIDQFWHFDFQWWSATERKNLKVVLESQKVEFSD